MSYCSVKWCGKNSKTSNSSKDGITFYRFPRCPDIKSKWIDATCRGDDWFPSSSSVICSRHFSDEYFHITKKNYRRLLKNAVPTLFLPILDSQPRNSSSTIVMPPPECDMSKTDLQAENSSEKIISPTPNGELLRSILSSSSVTEQSTSYNNQTNDAETPRRQRKLDSDNPSDYSSLIEKRLCHRISELKNIITIKNKAIRKERDCNRRLKRKIASLKWSLAELEKKE